MAALDLDRLRRAGHPARRQPPDLGVGRGDRVVLMMRNRPEFHVADLAVMLLGATPISIYNSSAADQVQYLVGHCEASVAILEDEGSSTASSRCARRCRACATSSRSSRRRPARRRARLGRPDRRRPARPRGRGGDRAARGHRDRHLHVGDDRPAEGRGARPPEHLLDDREPAAVPRRRRGRGPPARLVPPDGPHRRADDLALPGRSRSATRSRPVPRADTIAQYLPEVRPEIFFAVPRVWEKMHSGIMAMAAADPERKEQLEARARRRAQGVRLPGATARSCPTTCARSGRPSDARGPRPRPLAHRARRVHRRDQRRRADRGRGVRLLPGARRADLRDLRHERVVRAR